jgi:pimeloyl-ACP methyl ester carboxylesterase
MRHFIRDRSRRFSSEISATPTDFGPSVQEFGSNEAGRRAYLSTASQSDVRSHSIREEIVANRGGCPFYSYTPRSASQAPRHSLLVAVHGISRNALEVITQFAPHAEEHKITVIAPQFGEEEFKDYQRLGRVGHGRRADHALNDAVASFSRSRGIEFDRQFFFGFSGGGQFVHRYAMAYPERVSAAIVVAAGWYTPPNSRRRYPRGLRVAGALPGIRLEPENFLRVPILTLVGDRDVSRDASVRVRPWLDREQGRSRVERAECWTKLMQHAAARSGIDGLHEFAELPGVGHSFPDCMNAGLAERLFAFIERCETRL